jgi:hypothetical protein
MRGTKHADDWLIDHDALSQLTHGVTLDWLKSKVGPNGVSYYDRWLLPKLGLNEGTNFDGRPVGNHPEHMPWDCSLNKDVDDCVAYHVTITADKDFKDDPRRFVLDTPSRIDFAYLRVMEPTLGPNAGAPLGKRIVQDFAKCYGRHLSIICEAHGWAVQGVGSRNGYRNHPSYFGPPEVVKANAHLVPKKFGNGGRRVKSEKPDPLRWTHPDAVEIAKKIPLKARLRWLGLQEGFESWFWAA